MQWPCLTVLCRIGNGLEASTRAKPRNQSAASPSQGIVGGLIPLGWGPWLGPGRRGRAHGCGLLRHPQPLAFVVLRGASIGQAMAFGRVGPVLADFIHTVSPRIPGGSGDASTRQGGSCRRVVGRNGRASPFCVELGMGLKRACGQSRTRAPSELKRPPPAGVTGPSPPPPRAEPPGDAGFLHLIQSSVRPERYGEPLRLEITPSRPRRQACRNTASPSASTSGGRPRVEVAASALEQAAEERRPSCTPPTRCLHRWKQRN
jgi:hypothetical protein